MTITIFDKTDKGREEIATRALHMAPRLRTLLLLVDGKRDTPELMAKVAGLGLNEKSLVELLEGGFIQVMDDGKVETATPVVAERTLAPEGEPVSNAPVAAPATVETIENTDAPRPKPGEGILREGETQFQALYNFYNETIRSAIGLRGFAMQLKVERATSIDDFRLIRQSYLEAVLRSKGPELERSLRNRLDQLLSVG